jgi:hypothetical protein
MATGIAPEALLSRAQSARAQVRQHEKPSMFRSPSPSSHSLHSLHSPPLHLSLCSAAITLTLFTKALALRERIRQSGTGLRLLAAAPPSREPPADEDSRTMLACRELWDEIEAVRIMWKGENKGGVVSGGIDGVVLHCQDTYAALASLLFGVEQAVASRGGRVRRAGEPAVWSRASSARARRARTARWRACRLE